MEFWALVLLIKIYPSLIRSIFSSDSINIRDAKDYGFIKFDLKVTEGDRSIVFKADCGYPCTGGDQYVEVLEENKWQTVIVPVKSLIPNPYGSDLDLEILRTSLVIGSLHQRATTFRIDNAYYDCRADTCAGEEAPFELVDWDATHEDSSDPVDTTLTSYPGYTLAWSDEFDGSGAVNTTNWFLQTQLPSGGSWYNGELQHYTNRQINSFLNNGSLNIVAKRETFTDQGQTKQFTSARLNSKFAFKNTSVPNVHS